jgi:hypothetical protein
LGEVALIACGRWESSGVTVTVVPPGYFVDVRVLSWL